MSAPHNPYHTLLFVLAGAIFVWSLFLFFQSAYFAAIFYGVPIPSWAAWVGQMPVWGFNAIDTVAVAIVILTAVLTYRAKHQRDRVHHSTRRMGHRGSAAGTALLAIVVLAILILLGFTFQSFVAGVRHFFGI